MTSDQTTGTAIIRRERHRKAGQWWPAETEPQLRKGSVQRYQLPPVTARVSSLPVSHLLAYKNVCSSLSVFCVRQPRCPSSLSLRQRSHIPSVYRAQCLHSNTVVSNKDGLIWYLCSESHSFPSDKTVHVTHHLLLNFCNTLCIMHLNALCY